MYSAHNERKSVFPKDLLQCYRTKFISIRLTSKNVHLEKLDDIGYKDNIRIIA